MDSAKLPHNIGKADKADKVGKAVEASPNARKESSTALDTKRVHIRTYGCQMNVYDSERMGELLANLGYQHTQKAEEADVIILNTCHIREKAAEKVYSEIGRLVPIKQARGTKLIVAGCVAQAEGEAIMERSPQVDFVVGPQSYPQLANFLTSQPAVSGDSDVKPLLLSRSERVITEFPIVDKFDSLPKQREIGKGIYSAFLTIQEGCDKFCSFCVVPYTRGAEVSRSAAQIIAEARQMVEAGVKEITLLGQNVNAWHGEPLRSSSHGPRQWGLGELIRELASIDGLLRLRYTTSHPKDMDDGLIDAHREVAKLMPYLHLPVQAGSNQVLKAMNRRHDRDFYLRLVEKLRHACPEIALSSDFIIAYPGESDEDFADTLRLVNEVGFASAYSFIFSPRAGTPAAELAEVPRQKAKDRLQTLQQLLNAWQQRFQLSMVGRNMPILLEKRGRHKGQLVGRSPWLQPVHITIGEEYLGHEIMVNITHTQAHSLFAEKVALAA